MPSPKTLSCTCQNCGKEFKLAPNRLRYGEGKFCSRQCGYAAKQIPLTVRFWSKVQKTNTCWIWTGAHNHQGYGRITVDGARKPAHQISWEMKNGPIPVGHEICHHCDNPSCVRPDHLFLGTRKDNVQDMIKKGRRSTLAHGTGERHGMSKLTCVQVVDIRKRYAAGESPKLLAIEFGIDRTHIYRITKRKIWKSV